MGSFNMKQQLNLGHAVLLGGSIVAQPVWGPEFEN